MRLHYMKERRDWATYCQDRNPRYHRFDPIAPSRRVENLLAAVDADSIAIFRG